jgi:uncharacterized protein
MKRIITFLICILLVICLVPQGFAQSPKVVDDAFLLTDSEEQALEDKAQSLTDEYGMDVVIVTVWSLNGRSAQSYADDYFDYNGYGIGEESSGVIFLLSMEHRDWAISTCGETIYALTDYGIETLFESCKGYLGNDQYYRAFDVYLTNLERYFNAYQQGNAFDGYHDSDEDDYIIYDPDDSGGVVHYDPKPTSGVILKAFGISLLLGLAGGGIALLVMRNGMNSFVPQHNATQYISYGGIQITGRKDTFLHSSVSKTRRETESESSYRGFSSSSGGFSSSRGGGSSFHRSSSGRSHGGRSGKF